MKNQYCLSGKRVWVAGHNGMVGSSLLRLLKNEDVILLKIDKSDLDLRNQSLVDQWIKDNKPDVIIISAAKVGGIMANINNPAEFFYDNISIGTNIIHSAYKMGVKRLLYLGSSCIYPKDTSQPINESDLLSGKLEPSNEAYAIAKIACLKMVEYYHKQYGCNFISAMPCNLYGVGDRYDKINSHVIPALIMKIHEAKINNLDNITIWGSGNALREFLYVDDLSDALIFLIKNYNSSSHINIGSSIEVRIKDLVKLICDIIGYNGDIVFDKNMPEGVPRKILNNSEIFSKKWLPKTSLKDGIKKAYKDYLAKNH